MFFLLLLETLFSVGVCSSEFTSFRLPDGDMSFKMIDQSYNEKFWMDFSFKPYKGSFPFLIACLDYHGTLMHKHFPPPPSHRYDHTPHRPSHSGSPPHPRFASSNAVVSVYVSPSPSGQNSENCGESPSTPCETIAYAYLEGAGESTNVYVTAGRYMETATTSVGVNALLTITGISQTDCVLSKTVNGAFVLFVVEARNSSLTVKNLTLLLTSHAVTYPYLRSSSSVSRASVAVTFRACRITMDPKAQTEEMEGGDGYGDGEGDGDGDGEGRGAVEEAAVSGRSFFVNNSLASLHFDTCIVYNITTNGSSSSRESPVIYVPLIDTFLITLSSFVNIRNSRDDALGNVFHVGQAFNATLAQSVFTGCFSGCDGGVGYVGLMMVEDEWGTSTDTDTDTGTDTDTDTDTDRGIDTDTSTDTAIGIVRSCVFWNTTSYESFGALLIERVYSSYSSSASSSLRSNDDSDNDSDDDDDDDNDDYSLLPLLIISNTSFANCAALDESCRGGGLGVSGAFRFLLNGSSFTNCTALWGYGGGVSVEEDCMATISRCSFVLCRAGVAGGVAVLYCEANLTSCVFVGNNAIEPFDFGEDDLVYPGGDVGVDDSSIAMFTACYTDAVDTPTTLAMFCESEMCSGTLNQGELYTSATCVADFDVGEEPQNGQCTMPCFATITTAPTTPANTSTNATETNTSASSSSSCTLPAACPTGYIALTGTCTPSCTLWSNVPISIPVPVPVPDFDDYDDDDDDAVSISSTTVGSASLASVFSGGGGGGSGVGKKKMKMKKIDVYVRDDVYFNASANATPTTTTSAVTTIDDDVCSPLCTLDVVSYGYPLCVAISDGDGDGKDNSSSNGSNNGSNNNSGSDGNGSDGEEPSDHSPSSSSHKSSLTVTVVMVAVVVAVVVVVSVAFFVVYRRKQRATSRKKKKEGDTISSGGKEEDGEDGDGDEKKQQEMQADNNNYFFEPPPPPSLTRCVPVAPSDCSSTTQYDPSLSVRASVNPVRSPFSSSLSSSSSSSRNNRNNNNNNSHNNRSNRRPHYKSARADSEHSDGGGGWSSSSEADDDDEVLGESTLLHKTKHIDQSNCHRVNSVRIAPPSSASPNTTVGIASRSNAHQCIGKYTVVRVLGRGSFGQVFECTKDEEHFAIKSLNKNDKTAETELSFATSVSSRIKSKFLVMYYETFRGGRGQLYVVMELCMQGDLSKLIENTRAIGRDAILDPSRIIKITVQLLLGLEVLHRNKIIHRDLKPDNIFVDGDDNVKIGDFGCAKVLESGTENARTTIGTPLYESPEVVNGEPYTFSSDLWSLGVLLYELSTLERPFSNNNRYILMQIIRQGQYKPIPNLRVPDEIREIIVALLSMNPKDRPSASSILHRPIIRGYADDLGLRQYYPENDSSS